MDKVLGMGNALVDALANIDDNSILDNLGLPLGAMTLIDAERFEKISRLFATMPTKMATGGSACNTILALGHLGQCPGIIGKIGTDERGDFFKDNCAKHGISTYLLRDACVPTGVASTFISKGGQRTFATYLGAAAGLTADDIAAEAFDGYTYFYIEGYLVQNHDLIECAIDTACKHGMKICIDMASYNIVNADKDFFAYLLKKVDTVFANEEEAEAFTGKTGTQALSVFADICPTAIVKVGKDGAIGVVDGSFAQSPAIDVPVVTDTTAAGDFFAGGFLYAKSKGASPENCLRAGNILSGAVIQIIGTALSDDTWKQISLDLKHIGL